MGTGWIPAYAGMTDEKKDMAEKKGHNGKEKSCG
jgi:hypothetical protein